MYCPQAVLLVLRGLALDDLLEVLESGGSLADSPHPLRATEVLTGPMRCTFLHSAAISWPIWASAVRHNGCEPCLSSYLTLPLQTPMANSALTQTGQPRSC